MFHRVSSDGRPAIQVNLSNVAFVEWGAPAGPDEDRTATVHFIGTADPLVLADLPRGAAGKLEKALKKYKAS